MPYGLTSPLSRAFRPSSTLKTAPHLGHLIFASLEIPAHPKEKTANTTIAKKILTHFLITIHLLSSIDKTLLFLVEMILTLSILIDYVQKIQQIVKKKSLRVHFSSKPISFVLKNIFTWPISFCLLCSWWSFFP